MCFCCNSFDLTRCAPDWIESPLSAYDYPISARRVDDKILDTSWFRVSRGKEQKVQVLCTFQTHPQMISFNCMRIELPGISHISQTVYDVCWRTQCATRAADFPGFSIVWYGSTHCSSHMCAPWPSRKSEFPKTNSREESDFFHVQYIAIEASHVGGPIIQKNIIFQLDIQTIVESVVYTITSDKLHDAFLQLPLTTRRQFPSIVNLSLH